MQLWAKVMWYAVERELALQQPKKSQILWTILEVLMQVLLGPNSSTHQRWFEKQNLHFLTPRGAN